MARSSRNAQLETRTGRAKLPAQKEPHWHHVSPGLYLGYAKGTKGGTWLARMLSVGKRYDRAKLGIADDHRDADGIRVLNYFQAQDKARKLAEEAVKRDADVPSITPYSVANAARDYLEWYEVNRKAFSATKSVFKAHILPRFGSLNAAGLTTKQIRDWHNKLATAAPRLRTGIGVPQRHKSIDMTDADAQRRRKATSNRVLTMLKAALNFAFHDGRIASDAAWRKVKPFKGVSEPKIRYLNTEETARLINSCSPDLRLMVQAALFTGCRYGELAKLVASDYNPDARAIHVRETKSGKNRHVPLNDEGVKFFERSIVGKSSGEPTFTRADGARWQKNYQVRPIKEACAVAKIDPAITFHDLRHTYASALAMRGVPLQVIAEVLGHADTRITQRHYAHLKPSYVAEVIRANLPDFGTPIKDNVRRIKRKA